MYLERLKGLRKEANAKQETIAKMLGITRQQYSLYETGKRAMPAEYIKQLAVLYNTSCDYILELTSDSKSYIKTNKKAKKIS